MVKYGERRHGGARLTLAKPRALPEHMRGPIVELRGLRTDVASRGRGNADTLMLETCLEADLNSVFLFLNVEPEGDTDKQRLLDFYSRHRFVAIQAAPLLMIRPPVSAGMIDLAVA